MTASSKITSGFIMALALAASLTTANAQQAMTLEDARTTMEAWIKVQDPVYNRETKEIVSNPIVVQKILLNEQGQQISSIGIQISEDKQEKKLIIEVPIGTRLDSGLAVRIDEDKPVTLPYRVCFATSCFAEMALADDFVAKMKAGTMMAVLVRPFPAGDVVGLPFALKGFTASYDGEPQPIEKLIEARKVLEENLRAQRDKDVQGLAEKRRQELEKQKQ